MAPSHSSSDSSETDEVAYPHALASSLAGLPVRVPGANGSHPAAGAQEGAEDTTKAKSGQLQDFLDLATRATGPSASDISSKLEQKRLEHERQREIQKKAFEEQMRKLEEQQEQEERELLERASADPASAGATAPVRSRSGNDLVSFGTLASGEEGGAKEGSRRRADYANAKSMPGSRRHSGEIGEGAAPANGEGVRRKNRDGEPMLNSFLFDDELDADLQNSAWGGKYLQMNTDDDKFPILVRRDSYPGILQLSASSAALDLAPLSQTPSHAQRSNNFSASTGRPGASEWPQFQAGRPTTTGTPDASSPLPNGASQNGNGAAVSSAERLRSVTHGGAPIGGSQGDASPGNDRSSPRPARGTGAGQLPPPRSSLNGTASGRTSPVVEKKLGDGKAGLVKGYSNQDLAQLSGPAGYVSDLTDQFSNFNIDSAAFGPDPNQAFGGYGAHDHGAFAYDGSAGAYGSMGGTSRLYGVNEPILPSETNRFAGLRLEDLQGDMLPLCKDQFGCRYLQKKLEDGNPDHRDMIFNEIFPHFAELMTDPFANYLSQRLLEYSTDEQRDALIESISGELVSISLNMHGTRAVQKMIDYLSTQRQVQSLILALNLNVVTLIKDLNGNHVIQKCLNHLPPEDNQFIYNAVATHCIEVATHRHGCCVLQRCIDHASESQRIQLVTEITYNSLTLVQDAFGNYVVQYVLDLNDNRFIEAIVRQFLGNVSALSAQKFSSNVVEKCIRVADATGRRAIIDELLNKQRLERLLRDSFANYVVQTALDYAEPAQRAQLIETIRPILPMIRNTPYGKRIQSKIQRETSDHMRGNGGYHPQLVPAGHFYGMGSIHPPPHQFLQQHPGHHMNQMGDYNNARSPYGGYGNQGPPGPSHHHHHPQGSIQGHQFAPFPGVPSMPIQDYQSNGMTGMPGHAGQLSNGGYGGFMQ
ncbi:hypothetical protein RQP46_009120 [Phenoliferia psychrophenolica]